MAGMNITWHGEGMIKIVGKTDQPVTVLIDPYAEKDTGLRPPRPTADIVLLIGGKSKNFKLKSEKDGPLIIDGPGEYDVRGVNIRGVPTYHDNEQGAKYGANTIYGLQFENIKLCHLGCLGHELTEKQISEIGDCDVLFVPVGGDRTIDAKKASAVISEIEPRIVIPTHYQVPKLKYKLAGVEPFLKEMGASDVKAEPKLKLKRSDLPREETRVVLLARA